MLYHNNIVLKYDCKWTLLDFEHDHHNNLQESMWIAWFPFVDGVSPPPRQGESTWGGKRGWSVPPISTRVVNPSNLDQGSQSLQSRTGAWDHMMREN
jgi:hypothetical protein